MPNFSTLATKVILFNFDHNKNNSLKMEMESSNEDLNIIYFYYLYFVLIQGECYLIHFDSTLHQNIQFQFFQK